VPLRFAWGEAFQFDWSEEGIVIGGVRRKGQLAHMKLCASRAFWLVAYPSQSHEMLFDAHPCHITAAFGALAHQQQIATLDGAAEIGDCGFVMALVAPDVGQ
jgi:hypothetical protein